ncbi:MAG TPA: hypothetical protein VHZ07_01960 [Bryobacteraceae bacterium]|nr:hypothetical protein [Bryobacteraceae bacterium]
MEPIGKDVQSKAGNWKQSGATSCPARERGETERTHGRQRRPEAYCVVWHCADGDSRFSQYVSATSVREAERRSKEDIQMALGQNARYWQIIDIYVEAPVQSGTRRPGSLFRRLLDRCRRGTRVIFSRFSGS